MTRIVKNRIVVGMLLAASLYWITGITAPGPWFGALLAAVMFVSSLVLIIQWTPDFYNVVREGELGDDRFSLMGLYLVAFGSCYTGAFIMTWAFFGNPMDWLNTPFSGFGRATTVAGFWLLIVSPNTTPEKVRFPKWWVLLIAGAAVILLAFSIGYRFGENKITSVSDHRAVSLTEGARLARSR